MRLHSFEQLRSSQDPGSDLPVRCIRQTLRGIGVVAAVPFLWVMFPVCSYYYLLVIFPEDLDCNDDKGQSHADSGLGSDALPEHQPGEDGKDDSSQS